MEKPGGTNKKRNSDVLLMSFIALFWIAGLTLLKTAKRPSYTSELKSVVQVLPHEWTVDYANTTTAQASFSDSIYIHFLDPVSYYISKSKKFETDCPEYGYFINKAKRKLISLVKDLEQKDHRNKHHYNFNESYFALSIITQSWNNKWKIETVEQVIATYALKLWIDLNITRTRIRSQFPLQEHINTLNGNRMAFQN